MTITSDRIAALIFLAFSIAYGLLAREIELPWGAEDEPFNPQTFPIALSWMGGLIAVLILIAPSGKKAGIAPGTLRGYDWPRVIGLLALMVVYALTIRSVGFFISTNLFLIAGFLLLGERRPWVLAMASVPLVAFFQFVLHGVLGIYLVDPVLKSLGVIG